MKSVVQTVYRRFEMNAKPITIDPIVLMILLSGPYLVYERLGSPWFLLAYPSYVVLFGIIISIRDGIWVGVRFSRYVAILVFVLLLVLHVLSGGYLPYILLGFLLYAVGAF